MEVKAYSVKDDKSILKEDIIVRRKLRSGDVLIKILYCGICHSDYHHIKNNWKDSRYPMVPGHEIIGIIEDNNDTDFNIGNVVAVGNMVDSCMECESCNSGFEQLCENDPTWTYNGAERYIDDVRTVKPIGSMTFGGYSQYIVSNEHFVFNLPENLDIKSAAPLLCAGITMYYPLKKYQLGPGKTVGIAGIGGLGHLGVKMAKAMGCKVVALTTSEWKVEDAILTLGADDSVLMTDLSKINKYKNKIDVIIDTIPVHHDVKYYFDMLKPHGTLHVVGDMNTIPTTEGRNVFWYNKTMSGSNVGGVPDTIEMLNFCSKHGINPISQLINIINVNDAMENMVNKNVKYRYVIDMSSLI